MFLKAALRVLLCWAHFDIVDFFTEICCFSFLSIICCSSNVTVQELNCQFESATSIMFHCLIH